MLLDEVKSDNLKRNGGFSHLKTQSGKMIISATAAENGLKGSLNWFFSSVITTYVVLSYLKGISVT